ncbi:HTH-type transcriptional regulator HdfR [Streptomyces glaucescens]
MRYIVVLAEELHFGRTARRLGLQQPTLSQQVRKLEDELGVSLFDRTTREVSITAAGESFVAEARRALHHVERAQLAARQTGRGDVGELVLGFVGSAVPELIPRLLRRFRRVYPGVELQVRELPSARQVEELLAGRIDVGILHALSDNEIPADLARPIGADDFLEIPAPAQHVACQGQQHSSRLGQLDPAAVPFEEFGTQAPLQCLDLLAQTRLRDAQAGRRTSEVQLLRHRNEVLKVP